MRLSNHFINYKILHIFNKSIAKFGIFRKKEDCQRFINILDYYNSPVKKVSFSTFIKTHRNYSPNLLIPKNDFIVKFIAYCIMPDHYHILIKLPIGLSLSKYINDIENSYTRYFNTKHNRKGPLWQSSYKSKRIYTDEQLLHVSRYIHLNPTTGSLVNQPEDWPFSSYQYFLNNKDVLENYITEISINNSAKYQAFVNNNKDYQKKLKMIKKTIFD